jgi:hypothetical protein
MIVGLTSALVGGSWGLVLGVSSAYFGGRIDLILQRIFDVLMAFPLIIMALGGGGDLRDRGGERHYRHYRSVNSALCVVRS